jgi:hypothetical protein
MRIDQVLILAYTLVLDLNLEGREFRFLEPKKRLVREFGDGKSHFWQIHDIFS